MARSAPAGSVVASRDAAMAVKSKTAGTWLEPLGELPDMEGALTMFAVDTKSLQLLPIAATGGLA